jgi:hypothetical protein
MDVLNLCQGQWNLHFRTKVNFKTKKEAEKVKRKERSCLLKKRAATAPSPGGADYSVPLQTPPHTQPNWNYTCVSATSWCKTQIKVSPAECYGTLPSMYCLLASWTTNQNVRFLIPQRPAAGFFKMAGGSFTWTVESHLTVAVLGHVTCHKGNSRLDLGSRFKKIPVI